VFIFGPCEPLIPILMYPAARSSWTGMLLITAIFAFTTIATMLCVVAASSIGLNRLPFGRMERYSHALAGFAITACGLGVLFLGL
jgi:hypothetical protein